MVILNILGKIERTYISNKLGLYISNLPDGGETNWNNWQEGMKETLQIAYKTEKLEASRYEAYNKVKNMSETFGTIINKVSVEMIGDNEESIIVAEIALS